ncbi:MAG: DUF3035 domain-containing protein [Alphaproteobacteria bacterium]|nr:MAG: DUF3035 domain-containing protein [Alphaproteobacteria bacterium]
MLWRGSGPLSVVVLSIASVTLAGCGGLSDALGLSKRPPDEFEVMAKRPLAVPPDFNLRPPADEELALKDQNPREMAYRALFPPRPVQAMPALPADDVSAQGIGEEDGLGLSERGGFSDDIASGGDSAAQP